jgi:hypothetical protein
VVSLERRSKGHCDFRSARVSDVVGTAEVMVVVVAAAVQRVARGV